MVETGHYNVLGKGLILKEEKRQKEPSALCWLLLVIAPEVIKLFRRRRNAALWHLSLSIAPWENSAVALWFGFLFLFLNK